MFLISRSTPPIIRSANRLAPLYAVLNAMLQAVSGIVLQPAIILAAVAFLVGGSNYQIAAFTALSVAAWALAPVLPLGPGTWLARAKWIVVGAGVARFIAALLIGFVGFRIDNLSTGRIVSLLIFASVIHQVATAVSAQATTSLILGGTPAGQRMVIFNRRGYGATIAAAFGALTCWSVFRSEEAFQRSVGLLLMLAAISLAGATWFMLAYRGGARPITPAPRPPLTSVGEAFRNAPFRRFASFRILLALTAALDPFVIVFGFQELGLTTAYIGWSILAYAGGQIVGHLGWTRWIAGHGPRVTFQIAAFLRLLFLTWAVALPTLATSNLYTDRFDDPSAAMGGFAAGFALLGLAASVGHPANHRYLMDIAPRSTLGGAVLAANLTAGVFALAPFGVAWLLGRYELERLLWAGIGVAIVALLASGLLLESRVRIRTASGSWRSRQRTARTA